MAPSCSTEEGDPEAPIALAESAVDGTVFRDALKGQEREFNSESLIAAAKSASNGAASARARAEASEVDDTVFRDALKGGEREFAAAVELLADERAQDALAAFSRARDEFERAIVIAPAARLRNQVRRLADARTTADLGLVSRLKDAAEQNYSQRRIGQALREFSLVLVIHRGMAGESVSSRSRETLDAALAKSRLTRWEDAAQAATASLEAGDRLTNEANAKFDAGDFEAAEQLFEDARARYRRIGLPVNILALEVADDVVAALRVRGEVLDGRPCSELAEPAPTLCRSAEAHTTSAIGEFEAGEYRSAQKSFALVRKGYRQIEKSRRVIALGEAVTGARRIAVELGANTGGPFESAELLYASAADRLQALEFAASEEQYRAAMVKFELAARSAREKSFALEEAARLAREKSFALEEAARLAREKRRAQDRAAKRQLAREKRIAAEKAAERLAEERAIVALRAPDAANVVSSVMSEYKAAYEARDLKRLRSVWRMTDLQSKNTNEFFKQVKGIKVKVESKNARSEGDVIAFEMDLTIEFKGAPRGKPTSYSASLTESPNGWQINRLDLKP